MIIHTRAARGVARWAAPCCAWLILVALVAFAAILSAPRAAHAQDVDPMCPYGVHCRNAAVDPGAATTDAAAITPDAAPLPIRQGDFTRAVFISRRDGNNEVYVARGDGAQAVNLTRHPASDLDAALSPDGRQVVFASNRDHLDAPADAPIYNLYLINADGTGLRRLTSGNDMQARPSFSPDGSRIAFAMLRAGNVDIYAIARDGSDLRRLTTDPAPDFDPIYTPNGAWLFWVHQSRPTVGVLMRARPDGSAAQLYGMYGYLLQHPVIAPDNRFMAYETDENGDGWMDIIPGRADTDHFEGSLNSNLYGSPYHDLAVAGWSPAIIEVTGLPSQALYPFFITTYIWKDGPRPGTYLLDHITTAGTDGWAAGRSLASSRFDFGFQIVSPDHSPPQTHLTAPDLVLGNYGGIAYLTTDQGGAGVAYYEWVGPYTEFNGDWGVQHTYLPSISMSGVYTISHPAPTPYGYRVRPWDGAGNAGPWSNEVRPRVYSMETFCTLTDTRGVPVRGALMDFPAHDVLINQPSDRDGVARTWFWRDFYYAGGLQAHHPVFGVASFLSYNPWETSGPSDPRNPRRDSCRGVFYNPARNTFPDSHLTYLMSDVKWRFHCTAYGGMGYPLPMDLMQVGYVWPLPCMDAGEASTIARGIRASATAGMHKPTLSFLYVVSRTGNPPDPEDATRVWPFRVLITENVAPTATAALTTTPALKVTPVFTQAHAIPGMHLAWIDLTPWQGRPFTLTFEVAPTSGAPSDAFVDEITIAPWETPRVESARLGSAAGDALDAAAEAIAMPDAAATLVITGENFMGTPVVRLSGAQTQTLTLALPPTETRLVARLPAPLRPGIYTVRVTNSSGLYAELDFKANLPRSFYLPAILR